MIFFTRMAQIFASYFPSALICEIRIKAKNAQWIASTLFTDADAPDNSGDQKEVWLNTVIATLY